MDRGGKFFIVVSPGAFGAILELLGAIPWSLLTAPRVLGPSRGHYVRGYPLGVIGCLLVVKGSPLSAWSSLLGVILEVYCMQIFQVNVQWTNVLDKGSFTN